MAKVAVLLATYNGEKYIQELLESLENQTMQDFHCYIHDDGSNDRTVEIIKEYIEGREKFELLDGPNNGSAAKNFLFILHNIENEDYVMFCDQDDVWLDSKIEISVNVIKKQKQSRPLVVCSDLVIVDKNLKKIANSYFSYEARNPQNIDFNHLVKKNIAPGCAMIINRNMSDLLLACDSLAKLTLHDWAVMILASLYGEAIVSRKKTVLYRQHSGNVVGAKKRSGISGIMNQVYELVSFTKYKNISNSVCLEKQILKEVLQINEQMANYRPKIDVDQYRKVIHGRKIMRMISYIRINRSFGVRKFIRSLFI